MHRKFRKIIDIFLTDLSFNPFAKCKISEERSSFNIGSSPDQRVLQIKNNIFEKIGESFWKLQNIREALPDQRVKLTVIIGLEFAPESNLCNFTLILTVRGAKRGKYVLNWKSRVQLDFCFHDTPNTSSSSVLWVGLGERKRKGSFCWKRSPVPLVICLTKNRFTNHTWLGSFQATRTW